LHVLKCLYTIPPSDIWSSSQPTSLKVVL
jgi:hypothetical protein